MHDFLFGDVTDDTWINSLRTIFLTDVHRYFTVLSAENKRTS
jgi:hypothetical protein